MKHSNWTQPTDIRRKLEKYWDRGDLLHACHDPGSLFPLRLPLKKPNPAQLNEHFDAARHWVQHWQTTANHDMELEWQTINNRQLGRNSLPVSVTLPTLDAALRQIGQLSAARQYQSLTNDISRCFPELEDWCHRKPHTVLDQQNEWPSLLATLKWMAANPRPDIYIRQLEIPGVHTKFIERNRGLLTELLDLILPENAVDTTANGAREFEQRYGFSKKPVRIRFRFLDKTQGIGGLRDLEMPVDEFQSLALPIDTVFIVENDVTALAFPETPSAIVIFGQGYGIGKSLGNVHWLSEKNVMYWGDIDTHGFRILNQLRNALPNSRSILMDAATLKAHQNLWGVEPTPHIGELSSLTEHEHAVYQMLSTLQPNTHIRLEQERISFSFLKDL